MKEILLNAVEKIKDFYFKHPKLAVFLFGIVTGLILAFIF